MDKDHRLDAPDNDSLRTIEQLGSRSELGGLYPNAHHEWEGEDLLSREAREEKRDQEQLRISLTIRKWFVVIGLLTPLPFILGSILITVALTYLKIENLSYLIVPVIAAVALWLYVSYRAIKKVYAIFYQHSMKASPFIATLLAFLVFSLQALYITMLALYNDSLMYNTVISGLVVLATSVAYSGILVFIWTAQNISGAFKIGCLGIMAGLITIITLLVNFF